MKTLLKKLEANGRKQDEIITRLDEIEHKIITLEASGFYNRLSTQILHALSIRSSARN